MCKIHSFPPIIDDKCKILILGSMPGVESLRKSEYYGHPRNAFWRIMFDMHECEYSNDYYAKTQMLLENNIALWDVMKECKREGSLDSRIKEDEPNDFASLYVDFPNITYIYFNGAKAYDTYKRKVGFDTARKFARLPSTSPAHAIGYEEKKKAWSIIINFQNNY